MVGGSGGEATVVGTAHWNNGGLGTSYSPASYGDNLTLTGGETLANKFHVFSLVWTENSLTWYIDDVEYHVMAIDDSASLAAFQKDFFLLFNVAVGGNWPGVPNASTSFPQRMLVDYVRVFAAD
jgi:beta-glucanase (GH16 family)